MKTFNYTTHSKQVLGDMHTPVSIYLKVRDMYPQSALMESSDYHAGENSLSFIALCPLANIGMNSGIVTANYPDNSRTEEPLTKTFTVEKAMNRFINQFQVTGENKNVCGLYGYTTFNAVKYFEHIPVKESHDEQNDAPDLLYILYKYIIVFNHFKNELTLVEMLSEGEESGLPELEAAIENRNYASYNFSVTGPVTSPITDEELEDCRRGLLAGMNGLEDTLGGIETWYYMEVLRGGPVQTPDDARRALLAVTREDVRDILKQFTLSVSCLLTREEGNGNG